MPSFDSRLRMINAPRDDCLARIEFAIVAVLSFNA
jgi:hypothetical protein